MRRGTGFEASDAGARSDGFAGVGGSFVDEEGDSFEVVSLDREGECACRFTILANWFAL